MRDILKKTYFIIEKLFPLIMIFLSLYIYNEILEENKKLRARIESLTSLISYKTAEILQSNK
jgi:hypothetical protein